MSKRIIFNQLKKLDTPIKNLIQSAPIVELMGETRVFVENHQGIVVYSPNEIHIKMHYGALIIRGNSLDLLQFGKDQIVIKGIIEMLQLIRR